MQSSPGTTRSRKGSIGALLERLPFPEHALLLILAVMVGLLSGMGAVGFHWLIEGAHLLFFELPVHVQEQYHLAEHPLSTIAHIILAPTLGGLFIGTLVWLLARHDHSHGTATVMEAVALHGGRLKKRPLLTKSLAAGVLIGAGGSAGPEDPSVKIGAVIGETVSTRLRLSTKRITTLITAGVASAIAAIFNAPIAGVFFALEVVAADFSTTLFAPVVLASVAGSVVGRAMLGEQPVFASPEYALINPLVEVPLYALLGLVAAVVGVGFIRAVFWSETLFHHVRLPVPLLAGIGGALVGLIGLFLPGVLGVGYETATSIINNHSSSGLMLLALLIGKFVATISTLGAARVGGTFAPSLVLGAMVGGLFGQVVNIFIPELTAPAGAYALVGMGAVLTAVVRAPITAVLLLFEVTGDYRIILAIMASVATSYLFASWMHAESIYTERLMRKGIQLRSGRDVNLLELVTVGEIMTPDFQTVPSSMPLYRLRALFDSTRHHGFPVLDDTGHLCGIVTLTDLHLVTLASYPPDIPVGQIATRDLVVVYPDQSLNAALRKFALADVGRIPVVERDKPHVLLGVLRRTDIVKGYQRGAMQRAELMQHHQQMRLAHQTGTHLTEVTIPRGGANEGRAVRDLGLPPNTIITSIKREDEAIIPHGDTIVRGGDELSLLVTANQAEAVRTVLLEGTADPAAPRYHELSIPPAACAIGRTVAQAGLPPEVLIVTLRRNGHMHAVHGKTILQEGDELIILATPEDFQATVQCLLQP